MEIRYLSPEDDLCEVSNVYEKSWKSAYKDIIPQDYLDSIPVGQWAKNVNKSDRYNLVATENGHIIGTCGFCRSRWKKYSGYGEIVSLYFLPEYTGNGFGKIMLDKAITELKKLDFENILLWVLEDNFKARKFYEKYGFTFTGDYMNDVIGGKEVREMMYVYHEK